MNRSRTRGPRPAQPSTAQTISRLTRLVLVAAMAMALSGCFNSSDAEMTLDLGSVSIGQQLMDLEAAKSAGAISPSEHRMIRDKLIKGIAALDIELDDDIEAVELQIDIGETRSKANEDEDAFNWF